MIAQNHPALLTIYPAIGAIRELSRDPNHAGGRVLDRIGDGGDEVRWPSFRHVPADDLIADAAE